MGIAARFGREDGDSSRASSPPSTVRSRSSQHELEARSSASSSRADGRLLHPASEGVENMEGHRGQNDVPPLCPEYDELAEVLANVTKKYNINWEVERQEVRQKTGLCDERILPPRDRPLRGGLPFNKDLQKEVTYTWKNPYTTRVISQQGSIYSAVAGLHEHGCRTMPKMEEHLARHLLPHASSAKTPALPSKPIKLTSVLVGKAYAAAGQSVGCLHTMSLLPAYQADLLKEALDKGGAGHDTVREILRASDLSLRATKEVARSLGRSMAAMVVTERHLWLNQADIKEDDNRIFLDAPISPAGLFGDSVNRVAKSFERAKKRSGSYGSFLPPKGRPSGAVKRDQPQPSTSSSAQYRAEQKESVASRQPPKRKWGGKRSQEAKTITYGGPRTIVVKRPAPQKKS